jgi:hypothetical protein
VLHLNGVIAVTKKVFISYSHVDEGHRKDFEEHLVMLRRKNLISVWHDRKIVAGDDWKNKIDENLQSSDIIIFLVSSSFLASDYCYDVEVAKAMEMQAGGSAKIISIIVRPCDWEACDFSKFQAVPTNAVPITTWENKDVAWLDAIKGIKAHIADFTKSVVSIAIREDEEFSPTQDLLSWTDDTEIVLTHRMVNKVKLSNIYVIPDMEREAGAKGNPDVNRIKSCSEIIKSSGHHLVSGEDQQGKTSLLKYFYVELLKDGYVPLYLEGSKIKKADISAIISKAIEEQYNKLTIEKYLSCEKRVVLIDNIDEIDLNPKFRGIFLESINNNFCFTVLTCHSSFSYISGEIPALDEHDRCELLGLGNKKREEIVKKWISLGVEETISDTDLYTQCDELKSKLNTVIKKNIVPTKPIYILMLLQWFEANAQLNLELTSYGHCYQQLIYKSFENAKIAKQDFDKYLNVLTEMSWWIFSHECDMNDHGMNLFFDEYCKTYLSVDRISVIERLTSHAVLVRRDGRIGFKYPYIYYFFVGKKIAEGYADSYEIKSSVKSMLELLHREDIANILIFITHHTKDSWVLTEIKSVLNELFSDQAVATLERSQLSFMDDFMKKIPKLILKQREIQSERDAHNQRLDDIDRESKDDVDDDEAPDILAKINKTFKGMEIAGQIIRNRHANLTRDALVELAGSGVSTGLRFLEYFIKISDAAKNEIVKFIAAQLAEHPNQTDQEIERHAEHTYLHLTYGVINAVIRKIGSSVGSKEALEIYVALEKEKGTPAFLLIKQAIELQFNKTLRVESIKDCTEKLQGNAVCMRILKEMIVQHIYMFPVDYKEKQQLSELLDLSVQNQRQMDRNKIGKGSV